MGNIIEFEDVSFRYYDADEEEQLMPLAVKNVSLGIEEGTFVAVLGHNGSGKSTLAKLLNGLFLPKEGTIQVLGMDTKDEDLTWQIRQSAGLVFQNPDNQLVTTIVEEDVAFGPENLGVLPADIRKRVDDALKSVGMEAFAMAAPHMLSGGQKQRIAIAGILAMQPKILIFDESTAMLDPMGRREVLEAVRKLQKEQDLTVIWITHFMDEAADADRVIVMDDGRIVMDSTPAAIFERADELEAIALDVPMSVKIAREMKKNGVDLGCVPIGMQALAEAVCRLK